MHVLKGTVYKNHSCSSASKHYIIIDVLMCGQHIDLASLKEHRVSFSARKPFQCKMAMFINAYQQLISRQVDSRYHGSSEVTY